MAAEEKAPKAGAKEMDGRVETVELASLQIDPTYQRGLKPHHKKIASRFDPAAAGVLHVGRRVDGSMWLIDGQQRRAGMMKAGISRWHAMVIPSGGPKHEAGVFHLVNGSESRKSLSPLDLFNACLAADDPVALGVQRAVEAAGLKLYKHNGGSRAWPAIACAQGLYRETARYGEASTARALKDMAEAWPGSDDCMRDLLPVSLLKLYGQMGERIDSRLMVKRLSRVPPRKIINDSAVSIGDRFAKCQLVIMDIYNKRLAPKNRLSFGVPGATA